MKQLNAFLFIAAAIVALSACQSKPAKSPVKTIKVEYVNLDRTTLFRITCETFDKYFPEATVKTFTQKAKIDSLTNILDTLRSTDPDNVPDIRGRLFITHADNTTDTVCLGAEYLLYKNGTYKTPEVLRGIIEE